VRRKEADKRPITAQLRTQEAILRTCAETSLGTPAQISRTPRIRGIEANDLKYFEEQVRTGRPILFTGAGFSLRARNVDGTTLPAVTDLTKHLWSVAFPGRDYDGSALGDVFEAGLLSRDTEVVRVMRRHLSVDWRTLPNEYRLWFSFPWHRIYTLNVDDLADAAQRAFELPRELRSLSARLDPVPGTGDQLDVVHLNGRLSDLPDVTFSQRQYGERLSAPDLWYENLVREMRTRPVIYVGTSLDEPPLWQYVEARGRKRHGRELRPRSFLLSPILPMAREAALTQYNVRWLGTMQEDFAADVLAHLSGPAEAGLTALAQAARSDSGAEILFELAAELDDSVDDEREFLLGREPRWSDITQGFAIEREFDRELPDLIDQSSARLILITGTAGSGKSASAMRLALSCHAQGKRVFVLNPVGAARLQRVRSAIRVSNAEILVIDDADRFGSSTAALLRDIVEDNDDLLVIAAIRSGRIEHLGIDAELQGVPWVLESTVPLLGDTDIEGLLNALTAANRLGKLREKPRNEQRRLFESKYDRQLLVAMIEVTTDSRFVERVESECRQLELVGGYLYAVAALAMQFRAGLSNHELVAAVGGDAANVLADLQRLLNRHLLIRDRDQLVRLRHRVIAERTVAFFQSTGQLSEPLIGLMYAMASAAAPGPLRGSRQGRLLIRLLNHELLIRLLRAPHSNTVDHAAVRHAYGELEAVLSNDYHYWLQRGSFETEEGDLDLAMNFIEQARAMNPDDAFVINAFAYVTLKRASRNAMDLGAIDAANEAFAILEGLVESRGHRDAYPFHIYGSQGISWVKRSPLPHGEKVKLMERLREVVKAGRELHPGRRDLKDLQRDLEREYLLLAVPGD
jgi:hypothetical protein